MDRTVKTVLYWLLIAVSAALLWQVVKGARDGQKTAEKNFTEFMADVDAGHVREVTIRGTQVSGKLDDGSSFHTAAPANYPDMIKNLRDHGAAITFRDVNSDSLPLQLLGNMGTAPFVGCPVVCNDPPAWPQKTSTATTRSRNHRPDGRTAVKRTSCTAQVT
jgi:ATP-dependent Zn protease